MQIYLADSFHRMVLECSPPKPYNNRPTTLIGILSSSARFCWNDFAGTITGTFAVTETPTFERRVRTTRNVA